MIHGAAMPTFGRQPEPEPQAAPEELDEFERLVAWEFLRLLDLGFSFEQAHRLIVVPRFSWHDAADLIKAHPDWPIDYIVEELS